MSSDSDDEITTDKEGEDLAAAFFKAVKDRDISFDGDEIDFADAEEEEFEGEVPSSIVGDASNDDSDANDDDEDEINIPQGAIEAFMDEDSGASSISNDEIYDEMKGRVFESAGRFIALTTGLYDDDETDPDTPPKEYSPPEKVPDSSLSAGEVVTTVLAALRNNDVPHPHRGVEILFGYSSPASQIAELMLKGLKPEAYHAFLTGTEESKAIFDHAEVVISKADYSPDRSKAFITARLFGESSPDGVPVSFIVSTTGVEENDCWLIDSMKVSPPTMRGRRGRR